MAQVFVSPGVYTQEIDQTLRPSGGGGGVGGAAVIGLSEKGPAFAPITFTNAGVFTNRFGNKNDGAEGYSYQAINAFMNRGGNRSTFVRILGKDSVSMGKAGALVFPTSGTASTPDAAGNVILGIVGDDEIIPDFYQNYIVIENEILQDVSIPSDLKPFFYL